jgi:hypothetical protein
MKRKDLKAYIRTEIINELTEAGEKTAMLTTQSGETTAVDYKTDDELNKIKDNSDIKSIKTGSGKRIKESDLEEMRKAGGYKVGDASKFAEAKELYDKGLFADVLSAVEAAGEDGISQKELGIKLGKGDGSSLNPILNKFKMIGVFGGGKLARAEKPEAGEETDTEEPDEFKDLYSVDVEDETPEEEEPTAVANDKELKKLTGDDEFGKSDEVNKAINIVKNLSAKIKDMKNGIERDKKIAALKQYINNNKALLKGRDISVLTNNLLGGEI